MIIKNCRSTDAGPLTRKGVSSIIQCYIQDDEDKNDLESIHDSARKIWRYITDGDGARVVFSDNEVIGADYMIYSYRIFKDSYCASLRVVTRNNRMFLSVITINSECNVKTRGFPCNKQVSPNSFSSTNNKVSGIPGQTYIPYFIIYRILGQPLVDDSSWRLRIDGLVKNSVELSYDELRMLPQTTITTDFHCVTGWSVKATVWRGVRTRIVIGIVEPLSTVEWVYVESADGYTTIIPFKDFADDKSIIALFLDNKPLTHEQGYPARLIIPHLYGWKSAKWITRLVFTKEYKEGYWEKLGYHPRGLVSLEERFSDQ